MRSTGKTRIPRQPRQLTDAGLARIARRAQRVADDLEEFAEPLSARLHSQNPKNIDFQARRLRNKLEALSGAINNTLSAPFKDE